MQQDQPWKLEPTPYEKALGSTNDHEREMAAARTAALIHRKYTDPRSTLTSVNQLVQDIYQDAYLLGYKYGVWDGREMEMDK